MGTREKRNVDKKVEFDVLLNGVYQRRVSRGVLWEDHVTGGNLHMRGNDFTVFNALIGLQEFLNENNLNEKFEAYKLLTSVKSVVDLENIGIEKLDKTLDVLLDLNESEDSCDNEKSDV